MPAGGTRPAGQRGPVGAWAVTTSAGPSEGTREACQRRTPVPVCEPGCVFLHPVAGSESKEQLPARTWRQTSKDRTTDHGQGTGIRGTSDPGVSVSSENI